jgi:hypothetical protein
MINKNRQATTRMKTYRSLLIAVLGVVAGPPALAVPVLTFEPAAQTATLGDALTVGVVVTDFQPDLVGAYDFSVTWNPALLSLTDLVFGNALGDSFSDSLGASGSVAAFEVALGDISFQAGLEKLELFSLSFQTLAAGVSGLDFIGNILPGGGFLGDEFGNELVTAAIGGSVTIAGKPVAVPEPPAFVLMVAGLTALASTRRRIGARRV